MTHDAEAPAEGPLSVDQAASLLRERPDETLSEHELEGDFESPASDEEGYDPNTYHMPPEPPQFWDAEARARFGELSPEHQALVLAQAEKGVKASARAIQDAAERAKAAEAQAEGVDALASELAEFLPQAIGHFQSRWDGVDWLALSEADPGEYVRLKAAHDAEHEELQRLDAARHGAEAQAHQAFVRRETAALAELAPELVDAREGGARRRELGLWLKSQGASDQDLSSLSALAAGIAYDAMKYRRAKAGLAPQSQGRSAPARVLRPTAPAAAAPRREVESAARRLSQTGRVEDAIALLQARRR